MNAKIKKILIYVLSCLIPVSVGALATVITKDNINIYSEIIKPPLAPPSFLFPIAWTILYTLMGVSCATVYIKRKENSIAADKAISYYALSLALNFVWTIIFFNLKLYLVAFATIIILLVLIIYTIREYYKVSKISAIIQIPYAIWIAFASYLTLAIWLLNK